MGTPGWWSLISPTSHCSLNAFQYLLKEEKVHQFTIVCGYFFLIYFLTCTFFSTFKMVKWIDLAFLLCFFWGRGECILFVFTFMYMLAVRSNVHHSNGEY